jgi:peptide/nickel transport system substrate-binding protein
MESWLKNFSIDVDGKPFKVYDPNAPFRLAEYAKGRGYKVPTEPKEIRETFGYGWFKYAPDVAEKLLIKNGFKRDKDGKWLLPDGKPWKMTIIAHTNPAHPMFRNAFAAAQQWKKFGIDVEVSSTEVAGTIVDEGRYDVAAAGTWPAVETWGGHFDLYRTLSPWDSQYMRPIGETNPGHDSRWSDPRIDKIIKQMETLGWDDPKTRQLGIEGLKILVEEMPTIPITGYPSFVGWDEYYWTNYPGAENPYCQPHYHWPNFKYMLPFLKPTGRK